MGRCTLKLTGNRYFRAHRIWYGVLAWSWLFGRAGDAVFRLPKAAKPPTLLLVAREPGRFWADHSVAAITCQQTEALASCRDSDLPDIVASLEWFAPQVLFWHTSGIESAPTNDSFPRIPSDAVPEAR